VNLPPLHHVGVVVRDIDATVDAYVQRLGLGPVVESVDLTVREAPYGGDKVTFTARYVFLELGNAQIELIQTLDGRSPYTDALERRGEGPHHLAFVVQSIDEHVAPGSEVVFRAAVPEQGAEFAYVDAGGGLLVELLVLGGGA
jgi:catechol 2,3-dioxygenase-like lactoylglutathione lyase family enzyme